MGFLLLGLHSQTMLTLAWIYVMMTAKAELCYEKVLFVLQCHVQCVDVGF